MNKSKLMNSTYARVRLHPQARTRHGIIDREWILLPCDPKGGFPIWQQDAGYVYTLGPDHIHSFYSDPAASADGLIHGTLDLNVQLRYSEGRGFTFTPIRGRYRRS